MRTLRRPDLERLLARGYASVGPDGRLRVLVLDRATGATVLEPAGRAGRPRPGSPSRPRSWETEGEA